MPASPENVSGCAPNASPSRAISTSPRVISAALALSPSPSPSTPPAASAITFFAAPQSSTPTTIGVHVDAEDERVERVLEPQRELLVGRRDHGRAGQAREHLLRHVRAREHGDRPIADERREALAGRRVEALREREHRRVAADVAEHVPKRVARHGEHDQVGLGVRRVVERRRAAPRTTSCARSRRTMRDGRPPRSRADDDRPHLRPPAEVDDDRARPRARAVRAAGSRPSSRSRASRAPDRSR